MKNYLRLFLFALALITTGSFAHAAADTAPVPVKAHHKHTKAGKKSGKKHKHHKKKHAK